MRQGRMTLLGALAGAALLCGVAFAPSTGARGRVQKSSLHWSKPIHIGHNGIDAISCPTTKLCVAGSSDGLLVSTDPSGAASTWDLVFTPPTSGNAAPQVTSVSCPTASFCAATTLGGDVLTSSDPSGGTSAWQLTRLHLPVGQFPHVNVPQVSCSSPSLCVAIAAGAKDAFSASDPTGGASRWAKTQLSHPLETVACTAPRLCVMGDDHGDVRTSSDPTAGVHSWTFAHIFGKPGAVDVLHDAACGSPHWCVIAAISFGADVLVAATRPTVTTPRTPGAWQNIVGVSRAGVSSGSCAGRFCAYAGADGTVYYPTGSFRTLTQTRVYRPRGMPDQGHISCASRSWCAMVTGRTGNLYIGRR